MITNQSPYKNLNKTKQKKKQVEWTYTVIVSIQNKSHELCYSTLLFPSTNVNPSSGQRKTLVNVA